MKRASSVVKEVTDGRYSLDEIRVLVTQLYVELHPSGLVSADFDFGTHRPGRRFSIERICGESYLSSKVCSTSHIRPSASSFDM
jgi:hypothetical protein